MSIQTNNAVFSLQNYYKIKKKWEIEINEINILHKKDKLIWSLKINKFIYHNFCLV